MPIPVQYANLTREDRDNRLNDLANWQIVYSCLGFVAGAVNVVLLALLLTMKKSRHDLLLPIALAFGYSCNVFGIGLSGVFNYTYMIQVVEQQENWNYAWNCWQCVTQRPFVALELLGNVWPAVVQFSMGLERVISVLWPIFYMTRWHLKISKPLAAMTFVAALVAIAVGYLATFLNRTACELRLSCVKSYVFPKGYIKVVLWIETIGCLGGFVFNLVTYRAAVKMHNKTRPNEATTYLTKIRYNLIVTFLATMLVSLPNFDDIYGDRLVGVVNRTNYFSICRCIGAILPFFVYLCLSDAFRKHLLTIVWRKKCAQTSNVVVNVSSGAAHSPVN